MRKPTIRGLVCDAILACAAQVRAGVTALHADCRDGQVFLQWCETDLPPNATLNVYTLDRPITTDTVKDAQRIGFFIQPHSACDWTKNPAMFEADEPASEPVGFLIREGSPRLDPRNGLFVHTVARAETAQGYYAVTVTEHYDKGVSREDTSLVEGANTLAQPITQQAAPIRPIWDAAGDPPRAPAGLPLILVLHSRRGGRKMNYYDYTLFGDASQGWREGLPHFFKVVVDEDAVRIFPSDRVRSGPGRAFHSFWYGYHSRIYSPYAMREGGEVVNYGERRLLWLMDWAVREFRTDPDRVYLTGSSMGGCGSISMALHHPDRIAAVSANVPAVSYTPPILGYERGTDWRITSHCGPLAGNALTPDGITVLARMNAVTCIEKADDLPFVYMISGRQDSSIPWYNNPPFYAVMDRMHQGLAAYWDEGGHGDAGRNAPDDVKRWREDPAILLRFRLKESFPAFSRCSDNRDPGNGQKTDGAPVGWINRGLTWKDIVDETTRYAISVTAEYPGITYPVTVDLTPRRTQSFKPRPGETIRAIVGDRAPISVVCGPSGLITIERITIPSSAWVRIELHRDAP